jgi:prepilin-type N-terminal cleavage/methylation domain-containing protein/prepilin-type processing-associated H-X9-DG protein
MRAAFRDRAPRRPGFTLIELLVVIAVVALLIGIALPVLSGVRKRAQTAQCLSNTRQIVVAINADASANGGRLPENRTRLGDAAEHVTWRHRFAEQGLTGSADLWTCPSHPGEPASELGREDNTTTCVGDVASSYALNGHVLWREVVTDDEAVEADTRILRPSHTILLGETRAEYPDIRATDYLVAADLPDGGFFGFWHAGKGTYAFQDGHAETIGLLDTGSPDCRWHNGRDLNDDPFNEQDDGLARPHDHPDWRYLVHEVYLNGG